MQIPFPLHPPKIRSFLLGLGFILMTAESAPLAAATLTWDANSVTALAQDGAGTWQAGAGNWYNTGTSTNNQIFNNGDIVLFGSGALSVPYAITVSGTVSTSSLSFAQRSQYDLSGGSIELTGTAIIDLQYGGSAAGTLADISISSVITGSVGLNATLRGSLTLSGANTYAGTTTFSAPSSWTPSTLTLDFSASGAPVADILYNGAVTVGDFVFKDGGSAQGELRVQGADGLTNTQRLGNIQVGESTVTSPFNATIRLVSGAGGTMNVTAGTLSRGSLRDSLAIIGPQSGSLKVTNADGLIGPWATFSNASGSVAGWAGVSSGTVSLFTGELVHATGTNISALAGYTTTSNLTINQTSTGTASLAAGTTLLNTLSMTDTSADRSVVIGTGNILRLGEGGGIQLIAGAHNLDVTGGTLMAGATGVAGGNELTLTNMSATATLTIQSVIANNGTSGGNDVTSLMVNGTGKVVLSGANTFTGNVDVRGGGILELQHSQALGGTAGTNAVAVGSELWLSGGITIAEVLSIAGTGVDGAGGLRSVGGDNIITATVTMSGPGNNPVPLLTNRLSADSGTLTLSAGANKDAISINTGNSWYAIGGAGDIIVVNRLSTGGAGGFIKDGTGTLYLQGNNLFGTLYLEQGAIIASGTFNADSTPRNIQVRGGSLEIQQNSTQLVAGLTLGSATTTETQATITLGSGTTLSTNTNVTFITNGTSNAGLITGGVFDLGGAVRTFTVADSTAVTNDLTIASAITNGAFGMIKTGSGTLHLSGVSTFSGVVTVTTGVLSVSNLALGGANSALGSSSSAATNLLLANSTTLRYTGAGDTTDRLFTVNGTSNGHSATLDASGTGAVVFNNSGNVAWGSNNQSRTLNLTGSSTANNTLAATVANNGSGTVTLNKTGTGTWSLEGANSYTGTTTISAGTLLANNTGATSATGTGAVTLNSGSTLGGTGRIAPTGSNSITVNGAIAPGTPGVDGGQGTLTLAPENGSVMMGATSSINLELFSNGANGLALTYKESGLIDTVAGSYEETASDRLVFTSAGSGKLNFTNAADKSLHVTFGSDYAPEQGDAFDLLDWTAVLGLDLRLLDLPELSSHNPNLFWDDSKFISHGIIAIATTVPEPGRALLLMVAGSLISIRRRRPSYLKNK